MRIEPNTVKQAVMAAAMVRLMHSMVRFNLLHRGDHWDVKTYGIPIPQVDQMPVASVPFSSSAKRDIWLCIDLSDCSQSTSPGPHRLYSG